MADTNHLLSMRSYFETGITKSYRYRKEQLTKLKKAVIENTVLLHEALYTDLKKSPKNVG
jgi:aldehyde dehydrogenase (NAD+)